MTSGIPHRLSREQMAWRAAQEIRDGSYVNLGIGIPEMCAQFVPPGRTVVYQSENGILGFGKSPANGEEDFDLINAGKKPVTAIPGTAYCHHADSFAMIRGSHIDLAILGAFQVAENGDLANWQAGAESVPAVGGAMDLVNGAKEVYILMSHCTEDGQPKLVRRCSYSLTGASVVGKIFTDLATIHVVDGMFVLRELVPTISMSRIRELTEAELHVDGSVAELSVPSLAL